MGHIKLFRSYKKPDISKGYLIIVDVQIAFKSYFTDNYLKELNKYCESFNVVQIFDNHHYGKNPDSDYLYDEYPDIDSKKDLYRFNNQVDLIEKRYNYDVDVDFYKKILDNDTYNIIKQKENSKTIKIGELFNTTEKTAIVYIGNRHKWHHLGKKLYNLLISLRGKKVFICGGSDGECIFDIIICAKSLGVNIIENKKLIYSATTCPVR